MNPDEQTFLKSVAGDPAPHMKQAPADAARELGLDSKIRGNLNFNAAAAARSHRVLSDEEIMQTYGITRAEAEALENKIWR